MSVVHILSGSNIFLACHLRSCSIVMGYQSTLQTPRDDKLCESVKKSRGKKKKTGPSGGLNPGPSEY